MKICAICRTVMTKRLECFDDGIYQRIVISTEPWKIKFLLLLINDDSLRLLFSQLIIRARWSDKVLGKNNLPKWNSIKRS